MWHDVVSAAGPIVHGVLGCLPLVIGVALVGWALFGSPAWWLRPDPDSDADACESFGRVRPPRRPGPLVGGCPLVSGQGADMSGGHADTLPGRTIRAARTHLLTCGDTSADMSAGVSPDASARTGPDVLARTCPHVSAGSCPRLSGRVRDDDRS